MNALAGRRLAVLDMVAAHGGECSLPDIERQYRERGWRPEGAAADLDMCVRAGDLAVSEGAVRTWSVNLAGLIGGAL